jgi:hypothetical protein
MPDIFYRGSSSNSGSHTGSEPTGVQNGDLVIALVSTARPDAAPIAPTAPAGWNFIAGSNLTFNTGGGFWQGSAMFWAYQTATLSYTFTFDPNTGGEHFNIIALGDPAPVSPLQGEWQQLFSTGTTPFTITPDPTDKTNMMAVVFTDGRTASSHSNPTWSPSSGYDERIDSNGGSISTQFFSDIGSGGSLITVTPNTSSQGAIYVFMVYGETSSFGVTYPGYQSPFGYF